MICTVACQEIEVLRSLGSFHLCLFLNYVNQTTKSDLSKIHYQIRSMGFPKQKTNFLPQLFSLLITKRVLTVCSYHVTYAFQSESTLYSCLNVKELLARSRREI